MQGKIVKGIAGFYYVHVVESGVYECKAKGIFRKDGVKPLVGDNVEIEVLDEEEKKGNIREILTRKNELIRPAVANICAFCGCLNPARFVGVAHGATSAYNTPLPHNAT